MNNKVAVVDYGMGNLRSVAQAVMHAASVVDHAEVIVTSDPPSGCLLYTSDAADD